MNRCLLVFWLCWCGLSPSFAASKAQPSKAPLPPGNRFLFVVETSAAMQKLEHGGRQAVVDLIYSGIDGGMRAGDTYGLWTFNDQAHAGLFPMQTWKPDAALDLASRAGLFLKSQPYENRANAGNTVKKLMALVKAVGDVTIFVISDGGSPFEGTTFDRYINSTYQERDAERRRVRKPFVTTLVARGGELMIGTVTIAGEVIQLPERPEPVPSAQLAKNDPDGVPTKSTNPTNRVIRIVTSPPRPSETPKPAANPTVADPAPGAEQNKAMDLGVEASADASTALIMAAAGLSTDSATPNPQRTLPAGAKQEAAATPDQPGPSRKRPEPDRAAAQPERPTPIPSAVPATLTVAARENSDAAGPTAAKPSPAVPLAAMAAPPESMLSPRGMILIGAALMAAVIVLLGWLIWKSRSVPQPSFISRSMDRR